MLSTALMTASLGLLVSACGMSVLKRRRLALDAQRALRGLPQVQEQKPSCELCGDPMPEGEEQFKYHGFSGPCPKPPKKAAPPNKAQQQDDRDWESLMARLKESARENAHLRIQLDALASLCGKVSSLGELKAAVQSEIIMPLEEAVLDLAGDLNVANPDAVSLINHAILIDNCDQDLNRHLVEE